MPAWGWRMPRLRLRPLNGVEHRPCQIRYRNIAKPHDLLPFLLLPRSPKSAGCKTQLIWPEPHTRTLHPERQAWCLSIEGRCIIRVVPNYRESRRCNHVFDIASCVFGQNGMGDRHNPRRFCAVCWEFGHSIAEALAYRRCEPPAAVAAAPMAIRPISHCSRVNIGFCSSQLHE